MGHYEDFWWDIDINIKEKGLEKQFVAQLEKMNNQDKHKYKDSRTKWAYAYDKVVNNKIEKIK